MTEHEPSSHLFFGLLSFGQAINLTNGRSLAFNSSSDTGGHCHQPLSSSLVRRQRKFCWRLWLWVLSLNKTNMDSGPMTSRDCFKSTVFINQTYCIPSNVQLIIRFLPMSVAQSETLGQHCSSFFNVFYRFICLLFVLLVRL